MIRAVSGFQRVSAIFAHPNYVNLIFAISFIFSSLDFRGSDVLTTLDRTLAGAALFRPSPASRFVRHTEILGGGRDTVVRQK